MPIVTTRERWILGPGQYLDVVRNNRDDEVIFAVGEERSGSTVQERLRFKLKVREAMRLALGRHTMTTTRIRDDYPHTRRLRYPCPPDRRFTRNVRTCAGVSATGYNAHSS